LLNISFKFYIIILINPILNIKKSILIFGPFPPPAGGVSVHIARLNLLIKDDFKIDFIDEACIVKKNIFSIRSNNPIIYIKKIIAADVLFIQTGGSFLRKFHILVGTIFLKKIILTIHGYSKVNNFMLLKLDSFFFNLCTKIILVNPYISKKLTLSKNKCIIKHAFIPPMMINEPSLPQFLIKWFVHSKKSGNTIFCANASRLNILNNEDLYGLDMCIELAKLLLSNSFPVSFIFIVSSLENCQNRFNTYKKLIVDLGLQDIFLLINGVFSFVRVIENSDIVLRPTNADGDAVTIREAIFLNKPVLASDVIDRPEGTLLFKNRDINDFYNQTVLLLNNKSFFDNSSSLPIENDSNNYRKYYSNLINNVICS